MLKPGSVIGSFEILSPLGAGGMGEVWRAHDAKLHREVAIKVLPDALASDPDRLVRFQREAQTLASLNHPNIAAIYDLQQDGTTRCIVLELVEGETLAECIRRGPLSIDEALPVAKQIADALEAAHEKGIVHRDLKPANIKITPEGKVKVLDFGLAKIAEAAGDPADLSHSPTMISRTAGVIMGTPGYLSPEQARGKAVDKRTDIWAFGCVLFEMLTGRQAFAGETVSDIVASILTRDVDWRTLPPHVPEKIREVLFRCLQKDPARRLRDIGDARISIEDVTTPQVEVLAPSVTSERKRFLLVTWILAVALSFAAGIGAMWLARARSSTPEAFSGTILGGPEIAMAPRVSPDGRLIAFQAMIDGDTQVAVMQPESGDWTILTHDRTRGFIGALSWSHDGTKIYYGRTHGVPRGVFSVPAVGGEERLVLEDASCPEALPDGSILVVRLNENRRPQIHRFWPETGRLEAYPGIVTVLDMFNVIRAFRDGKEAVFRGRSTDQPESDPNNYLYRLDLTAGVVRRISTTVAVSREGGTSHLLTVSADDQSIITTDNSGDLNTIVQVPRAGGQGHQLASMTHPIWGLDAAVNGELYVDQTSRALQVIQSESDGSRPQTILTFNGDAGSSIVMPDGRLLFSVRMGGRSRVLVAKSGGNPTSFVQTTEETAEPLTMVGESQVGFMLGSGKGRQVAIASAADGRILRRLEKADGPSVSALAASPDGKTLYYAAAGRIWAMPSNDGPPQKIREGDSVAVDPQGRYLIIQLNEKQNVRLVRVPLDGGPEQPLSFPDVPLANPLMTPNAVRADGRIIKTSSYSDSWPFAVAVLDPNTGNAQRITWPFFLDVVFAGWTRSGQIAAFGSKMNASIWRLRPMFNSR